MKSIGWILMTIGFLIAAHQISNRVVNEVPWTTFGPAALLAAAGVTIARIGARREESDESLVSANVAILFESMNRVAGQAETFDRSKDQIDVYEMHAYIDEHFIHDLNEFAEARKSMIPVYGLQSYAEVMNDFAAGERYLNRVWSCSVDGYIDEAHDYIGRARHQFTQARSKLEELRASVA